METLLRYTLGFNHDPDPLDDPQSKNERYCRLSCYCADPFDDNC
jgi:hypothetical protein